MSCTVGRAYIVEAGNTPYNIAQEQLGDGNLWREIKKPDGSSLTDNDASNLQAGQKLCIPNGSVTLPGGNGFPSIIPSETYEAMFPNRNALYAYDSLVTATQKYPLFCHEGSDEQRKQEAAAFLTNIAHETTGGWDAAPGGRFAWGLHFIEEQNPTSQYCDASNTTYPCASGRSYHGRGPIQLSWNYNYGQVGQALGADLLNNPDLVKTDGVIAFQTALWFWMTPQAPKPSCHAVMTGGWTPSPDDASKGRAPGFGMTINIINGGLECSIPTNDKVNDRVGFYKRFTEMLGVSMGDSIFCENMAHY
ncbi:chitinase [Microcoleus sp. LAD1_D5]|uniref:chitinase n=1 Tax=unclassified Microcoleus TaxID=2642155 RepID=UPI002FD62426